MQQVLTMEALTIAKIQQMWEAEQRRKQQSREAHMRWVERQRQAGTYSETRKAYNKRHNAKKRSTKTDEDTDSSDS